MKNEYEKGLREVACAVWEHPEPGFEEFESSRIQVDFLKKHGFEVVENIANTKTGYCASFGHGKPVIALLGEFDALYGLGQEADVAEYSPNHCEMGHGCGHHLLGTGCIGAGLLMKDYLEKTGHEGTIRVYGCPAEESGSGKVYMARDGVFDDVDIALAWHPSTVHQVAAGSSQSCYHLAFKFHGRSAHAAAAPEEGRSALDAVELTDIGANYLREHMESSDRIHYAITNSGGVSPNVVQAEAEVKYFVRSTTNPKCKALYDRVVNIAKGAALMTDTTLEVEFIEALSNTIPNYVLEDVMEESFKEVGVPEYTKEDLEYAQKFKDSYETKYSLDMIDETVKDKKKLLENMKSSPICNYIVENVHSEYCYMGSTDVGDVSWVVPTTMLNTACYSYGAGAHSWQWVAQGKSDIAMKGMFTASEVLAKACEKLIENPDLVEKAKQEFNERMDGQKYECPIPPEIEPHI